MIKKRVILYSLLFYLLVHLISKNAVAYDLIGEIIRYLRMAQLLLLFLPVVYLFRRLKIRRTALNFLIIAYYIYSLIQYSLLAKSSVFYLLLSFGLIMNHIIAVSYAQFITIDRVTIITTFYASLLLLGFTITYVIDPSAMVFSAHSDTRGLRYTLGMTSTNQASLELLPLVYSFFFLRKYSKIKAKTFIFILLMLFVLILLVNTRAGIISTMIFLFFIFYFKYQIHNKIIRKSILFMVFLPIFLIDFSIDENELALVSSGRTAIWLGELSTHLHTSNEWLYGIGYGNAVKYNAIHSNNEMAYHIENYYLEILIQQGIIGLFFTLAYLYLLLHFAQTRLTKAVVISIASYGFMESAMFGIAYSIGLIPLIYIHIEHQLIMRKK